MLNVVVNFSSIRAVLLGSLSNTPVPVSVQMPTPLKKSDFREVLCKLAGKVAHALPAVGNCFVVTAVILGLLHFSLVRTSADLIEQDAEKVERAIRVLEYRGFIEESALLRSFATFKGSDHWLNALVQPENAFAATNFPFGIITLYPDFFSRASDDTERAMILLHEARHLTGGSERDAFAHVWRNRHKLGWTMLSHGTTPTFISIEVMTRDQVPELFTCQELLWSDCTELLRAGK